MTLPPEYRVTFSDGYEDDDWRYVRSQLRAFNAATVPEFFQPPIPEPHLNYYVRDGEGRILGGILCDIHWQTLMVNYLWIDESLRGMDMGTHLLDTAEAAAREQGCTFALLRTFDFQARGFYQKRGFRVVGEVEGYPPGHSWYTLRKDF